MIRIKELRIIIAGSRTFEPAYYMGKLIDSMSVILHSKDYGVDKVVIVSGTARGADRAGEEYAKIVGYEVKRFPADWDNLGKRAGYVRNAEMAKYAAEDGHVGMLAAFWDGKSKGTKHMIDLAKRYGLEVYIVNF